ncbi:hypothetical protein [Streptomyces sp. NBC_00582]|uniref:hypothetical protein n=1 Tax=Streptomyces sp. NBC_00582 TaxID=2975783 RepID=UPI002E824A53|nr:hypothetical protein [Streptomyces sp. NBC_00582]WUB67059.1 hypothetical protein OG852_44985 [Streptomyces sp. NBC_00582]
MLVLSLRQVLGGVAGRLEGRRVGMHTVAEAEDVDRDQTGQQGDQRAGPDRAPPSPIGVRQLAPQ